MTQIEKVNIQLFVGVMKETYAVDISATRTKYFWLGQGL